jgi:hypothetical protein
MVYVLEITPKWHSLLDRKPKDGKSVLYVGETGRDLEERVGEHLTGRELPGRRPKLPVRPIGRMLKANDGKDLVEGEDLVVRDDLAAPFNVVAATSRAENLVAEQRAARSLKRQGHIVYSNGLKRKPRRS